MTEEQRITREVFRLKDPVLLRLWQQYLEAERSWRPAVCELLDLMERVRTATESAEKNRG